MTCKTCMTLRAKFVRWLGIRLGVMEPIKEKQMDAPKIDPAQLTEAEVFTMLGKLQVENMAQAKRLAFMQARIDTLEKPEAKLEVVK